MKYRTLERLTVAFAIFWVLLCLSLAGGAIYAIWHFVAKYW
jgi:preprotein translocase subunit SecG